MNEEQVRKEILDYLDRLCLGIETIEHPNISEHILAIDKRIEEYRKELEKDNVLILKR